MMEDEERNPMGENEMTQKFLCPTCNGEVGADATECPICGSVFEQEQQIPPSETEDQIPPFVPDKEQIPLPYGLGEEEMATPPETEEEEMPLSSDLGEEQITPPLDTEEEGMPLSSDEGEDISSPYSEEEPQLEEAKSEEETKTESDIPRAVKDYNEQRRKRYLFGALALGIGVVLFVLLWLVVVYDVLVTETQDWFGIEVVIILVGAGILFILGLFMIITYPKSSIAELLTSMPLNVQASNPEIETSEDPQSPLDMDND